MSDNQLQTRIIEEATRLFARVGFAKASVREIVEAVGVTKPTLYYHFGSKAGLFQAAVDHHIGGRSRALRRIVEATDETVLARLRALIETGIRLTEESPDLMMLVVRAHLDASEGSPCIDFDAYRRSDKDALRALLQQGIDRGELRPHDVDDGICALMGMVHFRISEILFGDAPAENAADRILDTFLNGVGA